MDNIRNDMKHTYTFAGLQIAPANLIFDGKNFAIAKNWKVNSLGEAYGKKKGSTYFNWNMCHNIYVNGWRMPTIYEWENIIGTEREGSVYNGQENACYAYIQVNVLFKCHGLLLFPDGATINGVEIGDINDYEIITEITEQQLSKLLTQGCAFLPAFNSFNIGDDLSDCKNKGVYMSDTEYDPYESEVLVFSEGFLIAYGMVADKSKYMPVRLVRE